MDVLFSGVPKKRALSLKESEILAIVSVHWPITPLDLAAHFHADVSSREARRRASARFSYYLQKLVAKEVLVSRRVGHALLVWPLAVEKYRTVHSILSENDAHQELPQSSAITASKGSTRLNSFSGVA